MLNLYEILEVSEKASKEVIEKAYRVLVKKYHPDLQQDVQKQEAEKKMKQINEAYEILSDEEKRKEYDIKLEKERQLQKEQKMQQQRELQVEEPIKEDAIQNEEDSKQENTSYQDAQNWQNEMKRAYTKIYIELAKVLIIFIILIIAMWFFPPTHQYMVQLYEKNAIIKTIFDIFINIIKGIGDAITQFVKNIFA